MALPDYFQLQDPAAESEIREATDATPGKYWVGPDARMWVVVGQYHIAFADQHLGGYENALRAGMVRVGFDGFDGPHTMYCEAQDAPYYNNAAMELLARVAVMVAAETRADRGILVQFTQNSFVAANMKLGDYIEYLIEKKKIDGCLHLTAAGADSARVIEEPLTVDHFTITFHDRLFDYYLRVPNMPDDWYVTEIGGMKVGFGSKYQLKKFLLKLKEEFFSDGNIPGSNVKISPIPEIEEPLVRRMGGTEPAVPIRENNLPAEIKRKLEQGAVGPQVWEISDGTEDANRTLNIKPTGPVL